MAESRGLRLVSSSIKLRFHKIIEQSSIIRICKRSVLEPLEQLFQWLPKVDVTHVLVSIIGEPRYHTPQILIDGEAADILHEVGRFGAKPRENNIIFHVFSQSIWFGIKNERIGRRVAREVLVDGVQIAWDLEGMLGLRHRIGIESPISGHDKKQVSEISAKVFLTNTLSKILIKVAPNCDIDFVFIDQEKIVKKFESPLSEQDTVISNFVIIFDVQLISRKILYFRTFISEIEKGLVELEDEKQLLGPKIHVRFNQIYAIIIWVRNIIGSNLWWCFCISFKQQGSTSSPAKLPEMHQEYHKSDSDDDSDKSSTRSSPEEWPPHACSFCGISNPNSVVKCGNKSCGKWFCNNRGEDGLASHIIFHLVKSKHNEIAPHTEGQFGDVAVECIICGNTNLFVLGFVKVNEGADESVLFVCRVPCVGEEKCDDFQWNPQSWEPLIQSKQLVEWIAHKAKENEARMNLTVQEINKLEQAWKTNPKLKFNDISKKKVTRRLRPVLLKYKNGKQYKSIFESLISEEAKTDRKIKESQTQNNMKISFDVSPESKKRYAYFMFGSREDYDTCLLPGNELRISYKNEWSSKGVVVKITGNQEVCLELFSNVTPPTAESPYKVEFVWKPTSYHRMKKGLRKFQTDNNSISSYLYHTILGQKWEKNEFNFGIPENLSAPGLPTLNYYQCEAIRRALVEPLCLIQGPPGTGKTVTSASIVYHLSKAINIGLSKERKKKILVCAPSNVVVDMLAQKIYLTGLNVVRFCSKSRESVSSEVEELTLHYQLRNYKGNHEAALKKYFQMMEDQKHMSEKDETDFKALKHKVEAEILKRADVICATCIASADRRLNDFVFQHVLIDEATQAIEPEGLLPLLKSAKQAILVGDHLQLGPVVICRETSKAGLNKCLFQRLVLIGHKPIRLQVQYRMHPELTQFPSNTFYDGTLQNGITERDRKMNKGFPWPNNRPAFFLNLYGTEQLSASGTSYLNRTETAAVEKIVFYLQKAGIQAKQIGIITPYKGQRAYIINYLQKNGQILSKNPNYYKELEIASVDGYQGREKDYIIVSCVRSNEGPGIGFLKQPRRLNVTITRAKYGMIVLGNAKVLYQDSLWNNLLNHFKSSGTLVEGNIPNFRPTLLNFPPPQKYNSERKNVEEEKEQAEEFEIDAEANLGFLDEVPITSGYRYSVLGYTDIPEVAAFSQDKLFDIFSSKKDFSEMKIEDAQNTLKELGLE